MKDKPKIFFHPIEGSAPLSISWYPGPYGDAHESKEATGVYFSAPNGDLLAVQFDDVSEAKDHQELTLPNGEKIAVDVIKGKVKVHRTKATRKTG
jgi:hypothetical protein